MHISALIVLSSLFFWVLTPNLFNSSKLLIILTFTLGIGIAFFLKIINTKSFSFIKSSLSLSLVLFILAISASLIANPEGRPEALSGKGLILLVLPLISIFVLNSGKSLVKNISSTLMLLSFALSLYSLLGLTILPGLSFLPGFMQTKLFTPTGDYLTTLVIILLGVAVAIPKLSLDTPKLRVIQLLVVLLGTISAVAIISLMLPGSPLALSLIPYKETWAITLDALKSIKSLFFGVGLSNYALLFTAVKPLTLNATTLWSALPQASTSELLGLFATTGVIGGFATIYVFVEGLKHARHTDLYLPLIIMTLAFILLPTSIPLLVIYFSLIAAGSHKAQTKIDLTHSLSLLIGIFGILTLFLGYGYTLKSILAEHYIYRAQTALKKNDGKAVYDNHLKAIALSPRITTYHMSFADTNLSLASALSQKQSLSDEEKSTISTLVQQSVAEAKNAITLRPNYSGAWLTLAKIYRNLINVATGADNFALENYARAVALDPANPSLRIEFGGLFYQLGVNTKEPKDKDIYFARARSEFQTAIQLRANMPNAYYNLSKLFETTGDYEGAYLALQKSLSLLGPDNPDLARATSELETLKTKLPKPASVQTDSQSPILTKEPSTLSTPTPLPSPISGDQIVLPGDL